MVDEELSPECKTFFEVMMYKIDRSIAIVGVIAIALVGLWLGKAPDSLNIATAAIGGLVGYIGGRSGK